MKSLTVLTLTSEDWDNAVGCVPAAPGPSSGSGAVPPLADSLERVGRGVVGLDDASGCILKLVQVQLVIGWMGHGLRCCGEI